MKRFFLIAALIFMSIMVSFQSISQSQSVLVVGQKGVKEFVISVVNPENEETYVRHKFKEHSYAVLLKKELDKWMKEGFKIVDSSTSFSTYEYGRTHEVVYVLVKESLLKINNTINN